MKGAGYETAAFIGAFVLDHRFGLAQGFDTYDDQIPRDPNASDRLEAERPASIVIDHALAWLDRRSPGRPAPSPQPPAPFFLWIHLYDPHAPYNPPTEFLAGGRTPYDGEIAYADSQVARLLDALRARGLIDRTRRGRRRSRRGSRRPASAPTGCWYDSRFRVPPSSPRRDGLRPRATSPVSLADLAPMTPRGGIAPPDVMKGRMLRWSA